MTITRNGHPAAVFVSPDDLEALEETLDVLSVPTSWPSCGMRDELKRGDTYPEAERREFMAQRRRSE